MIRNALTHAQPINESATRLAADLGGHITLVVPHVVPYPMPLEQPFIPLDWHARHCRTMVRNSHVEAAVYMYLCRDRAELLLRCS